MADKIFAYAIFGLSFLPLIIYPGILMAGIMAFAAPAGANTSRLLLSAAYTAIWMSLLYPFAWLVGWSHGITFRGSLFVLAYVVICLLAFVAWWKLGGNL